MNYLIESTPQKSNASYMNFTESTVRHMPKLRNFSHKKQFTFKQL